MSAALRRSFSSLRVPNYRRYFAGQLVSLSGNWMQMVAEMWLVLELTGSGVAVGITSALQFLPILLFGAWGGVIADRISKRKLLIGTQAALAVPAIGLWALTAAGAIEPWMVFGLVFVRGAINAVDNPTRQSFVIEMVGADRVVNAVGLNSVIVHSARIFGPAGAGLLIATVGIAPCFALNAASFAVMIFALKGMDQRLLSGPAVPNGSDDGGVRAALAYVRSEPNLLIPIAMMAVVGTLAFNFHVLLPLLGRFTFEGGAGAYTALAIAMAVGSVGGALATGARGRVSRPLLIAAAAGFGVFSLLAAAAPTLELALAALVPLGAASVTFAAGVNSTLQLEASPSMRGRVMALYSVVFLGSTPIGGPIAGWLAEVAGARAGLVLGGLAALAAAGGGWFAYAGLSSTSRGWGRRLRSRGAIAIEARAAEQPQRLKGRRGLDVEAHPVPVLDRRHRRLAPTPGERGQDRVTGADRRHLRPNPAGAADQQGEQPDWPKPRQGHPGGALDREAGRGPRPRDDAGDRFGGAVGPAEIEADRRGDQPPGPGDGEREPVGVLAGDDDADRAQGGRHARHQQHADPQQVAEQHQRVRSRSRKAPVPETTRSASR